MEDEYVNGTQRIVYDSTKVTAESVADDYEWERSIELKLSTQGKMIIGLGAGVLITLALTGVQGKIVVRLVKANAMIIEAINTISGAMGGTSTATMNVPYNEPEKTVEQPEPDQRELDELRRRMEESASADIPSFLRKDGDEL
jgi:hypothetical protein